MTHLPGFIGGQSACTGAILPAPPPVIRGLPTGFACEAGSDAQRSIRTRRARRER